MAGDGKNVEAQVVKLESLGGGVWRTSGARIIDRSGRKRMPIGFDGWGAAMEGSVLVDKTMLAADVLDSGYAVTLFCRPRRFGKTLNMTMLRDFFELQPDGTSLAPLFEGTEIWEAGGGRYRENQGAYPVIHLSLNTVKKLSWEASYGDIKGLIAAEYERHAYLAESPALGEPERAFFARVRAGSASDVDYAGSLAALARLLKKHHGRGVVILIDEYDAPVMAGYTNGYYDEAVGFLKGWLTGALKDGGAALAFACLTGVQRISKESIFSDLNNLYVSTPLGDDFDERYGFTDAEVAALAVYSGYPDCMPEAREWYDGYRFGNVDVYNPWSVINYLNKGCTADVYWVNTSSNSVVGDAVQRIGERTLQEFYGLMEPGGTALAPLDLGVVFPDVGVREDAVWPMLYLAGYLTTEDTALPNDPWLDRELRIPNREIRRLFSKEIPLRFAAAPTGARDVTDLHRALRFADVERVQDALSRILLASPSSLDLVSENSCHMLVLGLLFGMEGYESPVSNREEGYGRFDVRIAPESFPGCRPVRGPKPLVTIEVKFLSPKDAPEDLDELASRLHTLAETALAQIAAKGYDAGSLPPRAEGRVRWGVAFSGKQVAAVCEKLA